VELVAPDALPQRPDWLTAAGEEVWMDNIGPSNPAISASTSTRPGFRALGRSY
jgi:hypothetical protein